LRTGVGTIDGGLSHVVTADGTRISFQRSGGGAPLVLVHGSFNDHHTNWDRVEPIFRDRFTVYAVDRRNRGASSLSQGHSLLDEACDLVAFMREIKDPVFLVGHAYGAQVALNAARLAPQHVRQLVLYEPPTPTAVAPALLETLENVAAAGDWEQFASRFFRDGLALPADALADMRASRAWEAIVADAPATLGDLRAMSRHAFTPAIYSGLFMPICLQLGSESHRDLYVTDALAEVLPSRTLQMLEGAAHDAMTTAPEMYAHAVLRFFRG
jgi:pimeloyl-ACP methyl ester carboxylesterase